MESRPGVDQAHPPAPTLYPVGFAVGLACLLVGLIVSWPVVAVGGAIALFFGFLWVRDLSSGMSKAEPPSPPTGPLPPGEISAPIDVESAYSERFPRNKFLEGATLGLGAVIGGVVTVPPLGLLVASSFEGAKFHDIDLGPLSEFPSGKFVITTFVEDPQQGEVSRRTAYIRYNGLLTGKPSFTILSNRCAHLGCPVQANGPSGKILGLKTVVAQTANGKVTLNPALPAGFGCPCHGGQYDTEGNRTAGPPVRALDRYNFEIKNGHIILLSTYSVSHVEGTGAQAKIHKYKEVGPGEHVDGVEQILYPLNPPHH